MRENPHTSGGRKNRKAQMAFKHGPEGEIKPKTLALFSQEVR
jgi:hypothetical protein